MTQSSIPATRRRPSVYVLAGPNGAGKSTFSQKFLPDYAECREFVNADLIAAGLSPYNPTAVAVSAGRLMLQRIRTLVAAKVDFGFETTLAGRRHLVLLEEFARRSYVVHVYFLWLPTRELAVNRVDMRVRAGGHSIPEETIRRRFGRGLRNFLAIRSTLSGSWVLMDNSGEAPHPVARGEAGAEEILDEPRFDLVLRSSR